MRIMSILSIIFSIVSLITVVVVYEYSVSVLNHIKENYNEVPKYIPKLTPEEKAFWDWIEANVLPCDNCTMVMEAYY